MPQLTRRSALLLGGMTGLTALAAPARASAAPVGHQSIPARSAFARAVGGTVTATAEHGRFRLRLLIIDDLGPAERHQPERSFNLIFQATGALPDGIYRLSSPRFPTTTLLL